ncbi:Down syndrome cell adhesion molecule homolog isoform X4 [Ixodes scapularis]|uniref:Down syndrome cell adhesion molecule homolog isoform X4 n=1 Tax=Ixodes scapularis TaxID=6945 RepID=UPI001C38650E|nr:Down syndrome cell adhesion molecule homolog isoform X4 [Ixodes scapularis]
MAPSIVMLRIYAITRALAFTFIMSEASTLEPPRIQPFSFPKNPPPKKKVVVSCVAVEGDEPLSFTWLKGGRPVTTGQRIAVSVLSANIVSLTIPEVTAEDIGNYTCIVSNKAGKDSFTSSLIINAAPVWLSEPKDTDAVQGRDLILACNAAGFPKPRFTWKMQIGSREFVALHPVGRRKIHDNGTLVIESVESDDEGLYQCDVSNGVAPPISKTIKVSVHVPPRISKTSSDVSVKRGDIAKIACEATGQHPLVVTWEKDNTLLLPSVDRYETHEEMTTTGVTSVLVIHNSVRRDATAYVCVAKNDYGQTKHSFRLTVLEPPESPGDVTVTERRSRYVSVKWSPPKKPVSRYVFRYWRKSSRGSVLQEQEVDGMRTSLMVTNLHPGTEYLALVLAENSVGFGDPSDTVVFQTAAEEPSGPPMNVQCEALDTRNIKVSWEPPPADQLNGELKGYYIGHKMEGTPFVHDTVNRDTEQRTFRGLQAASVYRFMLKAFNEVGSGPPSEEVSCATLNGDPPSVPNLRVTGITSSSVSLHWNSPSSAASPVIQYEIQYGTDDGDKRQLHIPATKEAVTLTELRSGTRYNFRMAAFNLYGRGDFSHDMPAVTHLSDGGSFPSLVDEEMPFYYRTYFVVPVVASFTVIITAIVIAWACLKRATIMQSTPLVSQYARTSYVPTMDPRHSQTMEEAYDIPWNSPTTRNSMRKEGSYTRLKSNSRQRNVV